LTTYGFEAVARLLADHFDGIETTDLRAETTFEELGLSSLGFMELLVVAEQEFGVVIAELDARFSPRLTLAEVADRLSRLATDNPPASSVHASGDA
jgi:acyl carrier protein